MFQGRKLTVNKIKHNLLPIVLTALFKCVNGRHFIDGQEQQRTLNVRWQTDLHLNTKDQFLGFESNNHLVTRRNGVQETLEALPTIIPSHGTNHIPFNLSGGSQNLSRIRTRYATNTNNSLMNQSNPDFGTAGKISYTYAKGAKPKSGIIKSYDSEPNLQTFSMEKVQPFHKASPIEALDKYNYPHPKEINSIKSKLEEFQSAGQIESIKDRMVDVPAIPKIEEIPGIDSVLSIADKKSRREESYGKGVRIRVQKRQIFLNKEKGLFFGEEKKSHKHTGEKYGGDVKTNRFRGRKMVGCELQGCNRKRGENLKHSAFTASDIKPPLMASLPCNQQSCLCALVRTKHYTRLTKLLQKKAVAQLTLKRNSVELPGTRRIKIDPPEAIKPIDELMLEFKVAKKIGSIQDHVIKTQSVQKIEDIRKQLQDIKHQPPVPPILDSALKVKPIISPVEPKPKTKARRTIQK